MKLVCPICASEGDHRLVEICNGFRLHHCRDCDVVFSDPMGGKSPNRNAVAHQSTTGTDPGHLAPGARFFLRRKPHPGGFLLDGSGGHGSFLERALNAYDVFSLDLTGTPLYARIYRCPSPDDETVSPGLTEHIETTGIFDVVTLFDMIERVEDPNQMLRNISRLLKPGGMLVLTVPNRARDGADRDPSDKPPERLSRWTPAAAVGLLRRNGFHIARVCQWRRGWFCLFESERAARAHIRIVAAPLIRRLQRKRGAFYKNNLFWTYHETRASTLAGYLLTMLSMMLSGVLYPFHLAGRRPAPTLYIEARIET
jgi:2-polyprenyl-3-methyl-5-hydroxy-6-metoxy-1,4-benzoquinol methylase